MGRIYPKIRYKCELAGRRSLSFISGFPSAYLGYWLCAYYNVSQVQNKLVRIGERLFAVFP